MNQERINFIKDSLIKIGYLNLSNPSSNFEYLDVSNSINIMNIDISNMTISLKDELIKIVLPMGAKISKISFDQNIEIIGGIGFFTKSGRVSYESLIDTIDKTLKYGTYKLQSGNQTIEFSVI